MGLERKRPEDRSENWQPRRSVRCYLDDVDAILAVLREVGDVVVETADFRGDISSADELRATGSDRLSGLLLRAESGEHRIEVRIGDSARVMSSSRDSLLLVGAVDRTRSILESRQTFLGGLPRLARDGAAGGLAAALATLATGVGLASAGTSLLGTSTQSESKSDLELFPWWFFAAILAIPLAFGLFTLGRARLGQNPHPSGIVVVAYRASAPTWWERHGSEVLIGVATNLVVGLVFFGLGLWVGSG